MNSRLLARASKRARGMRCWLLKNDDYGKFWLVRSLRRDGLPFDGSFNRWHIVRFSENIIPGTSQRSLTYPNKRQLLTMVEALLEAAS